MGVESSDRQHRAQRRRTRALPGAFAAALCFGGTLSLLGAGASGAVPVAAAVADGQLYFTTYRPATVDVAHFTYRAGRLRIVSHGVIAHLVGADGILFAPDGRLVVGGSTTGKVFIVDPTTHAVSSLGTGVPHAMHLAISPDGGELYTAGEPGALARLSLSPGSDGRVVPVHGATGVVTALAFGPAGQVLYTRSAPGGRGSIGTIDLASGATHVLLANSAAAHGIVYDPWSHSYIVVGGDAAIQLPVSDPARVESELVVPGARFDQAAVTGHGQVLIASNLGEVVLIDYASTGRIGNLRDRVARAPLATNLDDVAPLSGEGAPPLPTSAGLRRLAGGSALGAGIALGSSLSLLSWRRRRAERRARRRAATRALPRWDRRRRQQDTGRTFR